MNITAVIVTHNRLEKLKTTIERSLQEDIDKIIIINNNSADGTAAYLRLFMGQKSFWNQDLVILVPTPLEVLRRVCRDL